MMLPHPTLSASAPKSPATLARLLRFPSLREFGLVSAVNLHRIFTTPRVFPPCSDQDRRCGGSLPSVRGTVSRAKGVSPDDRSLEALIDCFRGVSASWA